MNKKHEYLCKQAGVSVGEREKKKNRGWEGEREREKEGRNTEEIP